MERQTITGSLSTSGRLSGALSEGGGTTDYNELENKPSINGVELIGNKTSDDLHIKAGINYSLDEQNTGLTWIDGKSIYCKTLYADSNARDYTFSLSGLNIDNVVKIDGAVRCDGYLTALNLHIDTFSYGIYIYAVTHQPNDANYLVSNVRGWSVTERYITIYYTKV